MTTRRLVNGTGVTLHDGLAYQSLELYWDNDKEHTYSGVMLSQNQGTTTRTNVESMLLDQCLSCFY
jgi:hypothetical protein